MEDKSNATEAPTSAKTKEILDEKLTGGGILSADDLQFINILHQHYGSTGRLLTVEEAITEWDYTSSEFEAFLKKPTVLAALRERDLLERPEALRVMLGSFGDGPPVGSREERALTPRQLMVANTMLDLNDGRSDKKKLQDLGVSSQTYQGWLREPVFSEYLKSRAQSLLKGADFELDLALLDKVKAGDMNAIKYLNEWLGRFTPASSGVNVNVGVGGNKSDFHVLLISILEIIQDEVQDSATAIRISERFKALINRESVAQQLLGQTEPIEVPTVKKARELTPELQGLVDKGEGYE